jgi:hypothetical protein
MPGKAPHRHGSRDELYWLVKLFCCLVRPSPKSFTDTIAHKPDLRMDFDDARQAFKAAVRTSCEADVTDSLR